METVKRVYIEGGGNNYQHMFIKQGWEIATEMYDVDLVCFTGGEDVSPLLYGEARHPYTHSNRARDMECHELFHWCVELDIPMVGICRGSQFLCVANGGGLWQHVDGHAVAGSHKAYDVDGGEVDVTSTHHQMMRPEGAEGVDYDILLVANESGYKEKMVDGKVVTILSSVGSDVEAVHWQGTRSFGFQPHPEFPTAPISCTQWFFDKLNLITEK